MIKKNSFLLGFICGLLGPVAGFFIYYLMQFTHMTPMGLIHHAIGSHFLSALMSLSLIANLVLFFLFLKFDLETTSRGVLFASILYAIAGFAVKFLL